MLKLDDASILKLDDAATIELDDVSILTLDDAAILEVERLALAGMVSTCLLLVVRRGTEPRGTEPLGPSTCGWNTAWPVIELMESETGTEPMGVKLGSDLTTPDEISIPCSLKI